ncbi:MAG: hypothetical protein AAF296_13235 [Pseudomonadota bacterium]
MPTISNNLPNLIAATVISVCGIVSTAEAGAAEQTFQFAFKYDRADPAERVYADLKSEARQRCWDHNRNKRARMTCEQGVISKVVDQIKDPELSLIHNGKSKIR